MWPIIISTISLLFSLFAIWKVHLSPFRPNITHGTPTLRTYKITPQVSGGKSTWYIPSIDLPIAFINSGARPGKILDLRMVFSSIKLGREGKYSEVFEAKYCVNFPDYQKSKFERFHWLKNCVEEDWYPFFLLQNQPVKKHIIFEDFRWDKFPPHGKYNISFEIKSDEDKKWKEIADYEFSLASFEESQLKKGSGFCLSCKMIE